MKRVMILSLVLFIFLEGNVYSQDDRPCSSCNGTGYVYQTSSGRTNSERCYSCGGSGRVSRPNLSGGSSSSTFQFTRETLDIILQDAELMQRLRTDQSFRQLIMSNFSIELQRELLERLGLTDVTTNNPLFPPGFRMNGTVLVSYTGNSTNVTIPEGITAIGNSAFSRLTGLTRVTIPSSVTSIGNSAFSHCTSLRSITIPSSVTSIGDWAFFDCVLLRTVTISRRTTISYSVFPSNARITYSD